jgi:uncharacterized protein
MSGPLHVWVLSDNRPGHYNQSRGIVAALERLRPVEQHWLALRLRAGLARTPMRWLLNCTSTPPPVAGLKLFYRMPALPSGPCDVIVSTGGITSFANVWLARRKGVPNIFAGSLRRLSPALFGTVLTLEPLTPAVPNNLVLDLPPSAMDVETLNSRGAELRARLELGESAVWAIMLGGNGAGYRYRTADWRQLALLLNRLAATRRIRWLLVSSRRTGAAAEAVMRHYLNSAHIASHCWYQDGAAADIEACLGAAEKIFVTEDSMTMLTEAIYSQRPVISLRPTRADPDWRYDGMIERFAGRGWICRHAISSLAAAPQNMQDARCTPLQASPLQTLSTKLAKRLNL